MSDEEGDCVGLSPRYGVSSIALHGTRWNNYLAWRCVAFNYIASVFVFPYCLIVDVVVNKYPWLSEKVVE